MTNLFGGGSSINVNASGTLVPQDLACVDGQTVFNLTSFTYTPNTNSLLVFIDGSLQVPGKDYSETSSTSFTLTSAVTARNSVRVIGFPLANFFQAGVGTNLTDIPTVAIVQNAKESWGGTSTGTANAIAVATTPAPLALTAGMVLRFIANANNTSAVAIANAGLSAAAKKITSTGLADLAPGDIIAGGCYQFTFDGTYWQMSSGAGGSGGGAVADGCLYLAKTQILNDYTVPSGQNALAIDAISVATGKSLTISTGQKVVAVGAGGAGATDQYMNIAGAQTVSGLKTFSQMPNLGNASAASMIRANTSGRASTNTGVLYWSTLVQSQGTDISYTASATNGDSFTINTAGVYSFTGNAVFGSTNSICITLNSTQLTTNPASLTTSTVLTNQTCVGGGGNAAAVSWIGYLPSGSVIRFQTETTAGVSATLPTMVTASRVA